MCCLMGSINENWLGLAIIPTQLLVSTLSGFIYYLQPKESDTSVNTACRCLWLQLLVTYHGHVDTDLLTLAVDSVIMVFLLSAPWGWNEPVQLLSCRFGWLGGRWRAVAAKRICSGTSPDGETVVAPPLFLRCKNNRQDHLPAPRLIKTLLCNKEVFFYMWVVFINKVKPRF